MRIVFSASAWAEYGALRRRDPKLSTKLDTLIAECARDPFRGSGKPEPLKGDYAGWWSRRISHEDRLVYRVSGTGAEQMLEIRQCQFHY